MLDEILSKFKIKPTSSNMVSKRGQHVASNNVGWCWTNTLVSFERALRKNILRRTTSCKLKIWAINNKATVCGDISTPFRLYFKVIVKSEWQWLWDTVEILPQNCCLVVNSPCWVYKMFFFGVCFYLYCIKLSAGKGFFLNLLKTSRYQVSRFVFGWHNLQRLALDDKAVADFNRLVTTNDINKFVAT